MTTPVTTQDLENFVLFQNLTAAEKEALVQLCRWESYDAEETILVEGERADTFYVIVQGRVALEMKIQFGSQAISRTATTQILRNGQYLGWSALVQRNRYSASVKLSLIHI